MAGSVNKVILIGRVGKDPVIRTAQSGDKFASFSLATSERWRDKSTGEKKEKTDWHNIAVQDNRLAEVCEQYVHKGTLIHVEGLLRTRKWTNQNGQENYTTEVVLSRFKGELNLLEGKRDEGEAGARGGGGGDSDEYGFSSESPRQDARGNPRSGADFDLDDPFI